MNLLKSPIRRTTAVLAGALIGLAGAAAFVAPASAHAPLISAETACQKDGSWTIKWGIGNDYSTPGTVEHLEVKPADGWAGLDEGATIAPHATVPVEQNVKADVDSVSVYVKLKWDDGFSKDTRKDVEKPGECKPEIPPTTPPTSPSPSPSQSTPPAEQPVEPTPIVEMDCTTITIGLDNPEGGIEIPLVLTTNKGEVRKIAVKPGEKKTEKFSATEGFTVKVGVEGTDKTETIAYEQPEDCDQNGGGGGLPVTGAPTGFVAAGAAGLLLVGVAAFFLARRRKVKFTA